MDDRFNMQLIEGHEGKRLRVYKDSRGILTIGIGSNLEDPQAAALWKSVGVDLEATKGGKPITDAECYEVFYKQYASVAKTACQMFPGIDYYPRNAAAVICDMLFQLGTTRFSEFTHTIAAFKRQDWAAAIEGIHNSLLGQQAPTREEDNIALLKAIHDGPQ